jgi:hypothetical protein
MRVPNGIPLGCPLPLTVTTVNSFQTLKAPACKSIELYTNITGEGPKLVCRQLPWYGSGNVHVDKYDEAGYLALPPCLWGTGPKNKGLIPGMWIPANTPMYSVKVNHNTHMGHYGEMVRCSGLNRSLHSRMLLDHTPARLKLLQACGQ